MALNSTFRMMQSNSDDRQLHLWRRGEVVCAAGTTRQINFTLRTDLSREDALRIVSTLVPLTEVR